MPIRLVFAEDDVLLGEGRAQRLNTSNSIFTKLGLVPEPDVNRRVTAVLLHLADERSADERAWAS